MTSNGRGGLRQSSPAEGGAEAASSSGSSHAAASDADWRRCLHEASHGLVASVLGVRFIRIHVHEDADHWGQLQGIDVGTDLNAHACVVVAGGVGEKLEFGDALYAATDLARAREFAEKVALDRGEQLVDETLRLVARILTARRGELYSIASTLQARRELTSEEVGAILGTRQRFTNDEIAQIFGGQ